MGHPASRNRSNFLILLFLVLPASFAFPTVVVAGRGRPALHRLLVLVFLVLLFLVSCPRNMRIKPVPSFETRQRASWCKQNTEVFRFAQDDSMDLCCELVGRDPRLCSTIAVATRHFSLSPDLAAPAKKGPQQESHGPGALLSPR
jgi:hypothetical protein